MKPYHKYALFLLLALVFYKVERFCHKKTEGFHLHKIHSDLSASSEWDMPSKKEGCDLKALLAQPYRYLASGGQSYAFVSEDERYVMKFFKMHHTRQYPWLYRISLPGILDRFRIEFLLFQRQKLERIFSSCKIAFEELQDQTGLVYLNLNPRQELASLNVTLIDKLNIQHRVNLSDVPFCIQYRADNAFKKLRADLSNNQIDSAKNTLREIVTYLRERYSRGIEDIDPSMERNLGILNDRAIAIDIGSFDHYDHAFTEKETQVELLRDTRRLRQWLEKHSGELNAYYHSLLEIEECE